MIPLSVPNLAGNELIYVTECIETGWISTAGKFVSKFETEFAAWTDKKMQFQPLMELQRYIWLCLGQEFNSMIL